MIHLFEGIIKNFKRLFEGEEEENDTVAAHYGMKNEDFLRIKNDMIAAMVTNETFDPVLDRFFADLKADKRARVFAFAVAFSDYYDFKESRKAAYK